MDHCPCLHVSPTLMPFSVGTDYVELREAKQLQQHAFSSAVYPSLAIIPLSPICRDAVSASCLESVKRIGMKVVTGVLIAHTRVPCPF